MFFYSQAVLNVRDKDGRQPLSNSSANAATIAPWCDEALVSATELEERKAASE